MRIEVLVENQDPLIFPLNKPKIIIGSHESCDVVLKTFGISRRHLEVISENDQYFVIDQESLNGTYINDQKILPGKRVEFTSFFPVRLGDNVLVTLISDAEAEVIGASDGLEELMKKVAESALSEEDRTDTTRQISLSSLYSVKTEKLVKKRATVIDKKKIQSEQRAAARKRDQQRMTVVKVLLVALSAGVVYYNFFRVRPVVVADQGPIAKVGEQIVLPASAVPAVPSIPLVAAKELTKKERFLQFQTEIKCTSDLEKYLCEKFPETAQEGFGAYQVGTMVNVIVDGAPFYEKARILVQPRSQHDIDALNPEERLAYEKRLHFASLVYFLHEAIPRDLNYGLLSDAKLTFVLLIPRADGTKETVAAAFIPRALLKLKKIIEPRHFENAYKYGIKEVEFFKEYFTYYE